MFTINSLNNIINLKLNKKFIDLNFSQFY
jgi:hypothetical protein